VLSGCGGSGVLIRHLLMMINIECDKDKS